ncbi:tyrosine--tRNA ligase [Candidatus Neomarinimicrobiota bacterium]
MTFKSIEDQLLLIRQGVEEIIPEAGLMDKLENSKKKGIPLNIKLGCDPSHPDLHIGHGVVLRKLRHFQDLGHQAILVIGDFTGMIGDPSGRNKTRPQLTLKETNRNAQSYIDQAKVILDIKKLKIVNNSEWLNSMQFADVVKLASKYTVARMLERDDFTNRFKSEVPISIHEFLYPLAQGMDSVALKADIELGGTDQKFNLLLGRTLQKEYDQDPQVIITLPLLEGTDGVEKMSKSYGNHIALNDSPEDMYGKTLSIPDELITKYFQLGTGANDELINEIEIELQSNTVNPRDIKRKLGRRLVSIYYSEDAAENAQLHFDKIHIEKSAPDDIQEIVLTQVKPLVELLVEKGLISSKSEGRRLIAQNAVKINDENITENNYMITPGFRSAIIKVGKRRFLKIIDNIE